MFHSCRNGRHVVSKTLHVFEAKIYCLCNVFGKLPEDQLFIVSIGTVLCVAGVLRGARRPGVGANLTSSASLTRVTWDLDGG
jgi:hypothetical protein